MGKSSEGFTLFKHHELQHTATTAAGDRLKSIEKYTGKRTHVNESSDEGTDADVNRTSRKHASKRRRLNAAGKSSRDSDDILNRISTDQRFQAPSLKQAKSAPRGESSHKPNSFIVNVSQSAARPSRQVNSRNRIDSVAADNAFEDEVVAGDFSDQEFVPEHNFAEDAIVDANSE